ncbi:enoyl-CoA hydratase/isomerase family protein [Stenotrophomonas sp. NPDC087984]
MMRLRERLRSLPQITIAKVRGLARGGGAELLAAMDMRFASLERAGLAQPETAGAIIPGAGGTAYLPGLVGRARAAEPRHHRSGGGGAQCGAVPSGQVMTWA